MQDRLRRVRQDGSGAIVAPEGPLARGSNLDHTREYNRRAVLTALRSLGVGSRTEVAAATGLSLPAVSSLVDGLRRDGLVEPLGRRSTARGQPPIEYRVAAGGAFGIGLSFDRDHLAAALVDLGGTVLAQQREDLDRASLDAAVARSRATVRMLQETLPASDRARVLGVGVAVPGVVDPAGRVERMIRLASWEDRNLRSAFEPALGLPVTVVNDAIAAGMGAASFGAGASDETVAYVLFALGLGSSLIVGGRPHRGLWGLSGRLGHIPVEPDGLACPSCGGRGCLSLYASLEALHERLSEGRGGTDVAARFARGDHVVLDWIDGAADAFARAMLVLDNLLGPDVLVMDGRIPAEVLRVLAAAATERYADLRPRRPDRPTMRVEVGARGSGAVAYGAATVPIYLATAADLALVH